MLLPVKDWVWKSFISYTFPSITVQNPPSLLWFSRSALRISVTSSLFLQLWPVKNEPTGMKQNREIISRKINLPNQILHFCSKAVCLLICSEVKGLLIFSCLHTMQLNCLYAVFFYELISNVTSSKT